MKAFQAPPDSGRQWAAMGGNDDQARKFSVTAQVFDANKGFLPNQDLDAKAIGRCARVPDGGFLDGIVLTSHLHIARTLY